MQQLRERAAKIVQHLSVEAVSGTDGIEVIKKTIEASPIIKILDQKKVDRRRQKFLRLQRLPHESIESFLNRAEIYRRENQSSPEYQVGAKFYIGHVLDAARFTKRDLALIKSASGGSLEDEDAVTTSMIDLAEQLEGQPGCPIGRGEPLLDHEDKYLVQKQRSSSASTTATSGVEGGQRFQRRKGFRRFPRRKVRDALMAILEEEDPEEAGEDAEFLQMALADTVGDESLDEEEEDAMTSFAPPTTSAPMSGEQSVCVTSPAQGGPGDSQSPAMMEIYAQEYKARQRVREIKKMRQYFQKGQGKGQRQRDPAAQRWIEEQQKTEPCFICHKLGHWSQECPFRQQKGATHATNVTFPLGPTNGSEWDLLQTMSGDGAYMQRSQQAARSSYMSILTVNSTPVPNEVCWSMDEMGNKMILDLGCMKTVAGTDWINPIVKTLKQQGRYCRVTPERESFRFGDGHLTHSKFSVLMEVSLATIPCVLRVSVVSGNCPPLLSKHVATTLGFIIDTEAHSLISKKFHVSTYGLEQSSTGTQLGGHYMLPVLDFQHNVTIPKDLQVPSHVEVFPLVPAGIPKGVSSNPIAPSKFSIRSQPVDGAQTFQEYTTGVRNRLQRGKHTMGGRGHGESPELGCGRSAGAAQEVRSAEGRSEESGSPDFIQEEIYGGGGIYGGPADGINPTSDAYHGAHGNDARDDETAGTPAGEHRGHQDRPQKKKKEKKPKSAKAEAKAALTGSQADFPTLSTEFSDDITFNVMNSLRSQGLVFKWKMLLLMMRVKKAVEDPQHQPRRKWKRNPRWIMHMHGRHLATVGTCGISSSAMLESQDLLVGNDRDGGREGIPEEGVLMPSDPNAPTVREQQRRYEDRVDLVAEEFVMDGSLSPGQGEPYDAGGGDDSGPRELPGQMQKITLNRRQKRSIEQGVQRALQTHRRIHDVAAAKGHKWTLLELFSGCSNLTKEADKRSNWETLPPQDILFGIDLTKEEHQEVLKDVIRTQQPDVITLSPPCGPWSTWQRMRKRKGVLRELRREHMPFWRFVVWVWAHQTATGGLAVLEQPLQSEALKLSVMSSRRIVCQKDINLCGLGLCDRVNGKPHKKPTAAITQFPDVPCTHQPGQHQPIEGSVTIQRSDGTTQSVKRSTLAGEWTPQFCAWLLDGLERALQEAAVEVHIAMPDPVPINRVWETVPVEVEETPEGQLRQQLALHDYDTKYDYISFAGTAALLSKRLRSTLAHLHVALGHVSNDKLARMLAQNGAKDEVIASVKQLKCQICMQVQSPHATPKASFSRPCSFNERLVSDTFYVWDTEKQKFAITHVLDAFSLYTVAIAAKDASAAVTTELLRDRWFGVFGPPSVLMTDQGSEYQGVLEQLLRTFAVFHDMVPPTAHWRMALAERHGAVLKLLIMKIVKEVAAFGLDEMRTVVTSAVASRNRQARVSGFSPIQLVFGKDTSVPSNLMEALAGQFKFQMTKPTTVDDTFRRAAQIRKAAPDAFQWLEANDALKRAAGSRARLPRLELLTAGSQVMFWEPPAHRRGLAKRLQDQVSWVGPAVVVACERKDGAIKRVWLRYRHKLKGVPLEYVRLAAPEEQEVSETVKEALHDLEQQLNSGRVNAEEDPGQAGFDAPERPDIAPRVSPQYPPVEYSDEEMQPDDPKPVTEEELRRSTSVLDDVPFQLHRRAAEPARSSAASSQPSKRQKTTIEDPHRLPFAQKKEMYEKATRLTKNHLQSMKAKLEKHRQQASESDVSESISSQGVGDRPQQPPLTRLSRISETLELAHYPDVEDESHSGSAASSINSPPFIDPRALQEDEKELTKNIRWALLASMRVITDYFDPAEGHPQLGAMHHVRSEVRRDRGLDLADPRFLDPGTSYG